MWRGPSSALRALSALRQGCAPLEASATELAFVGATAHHPAARLLHAAAAAWGPGNPIDRFVENAEPVDEVEQAVRSEVDVEIDETAAAAPAAAALGPWISPCGEQVTHTALVHGREWTFEVGRLARLSDSAASLRAGATTVLATICSAPGQLWNRRDVRAAPFSSEYREKLYAVGKIPTTYNKREGAPKEHEMLAARRLERATRPLLPRGYSYTTGVTASVLSADGADDPEVLALNAASAALAASDIPWGGPLGAARVALIDGEVVVNPKPGAEEGAALSMLVAATEGRLVMLEAAAAEGSGGVPEGAFLEALRAGVAAARASIPAQRQLAAARRRPKRGAELAGADPAAARRVADAARAAAGRILRSEDLGCAARTAALADAKAQISEAMRAAGAWRAEFARVPGSGCVTGSDIDHAFSATLGAEMRALAINEGLRADGRGAMDLRPLAVAADHVPVVHGSALLDAGDTQALCTATVGGSMEQQRIETLLGGEGVKRMFVHFSLPNFAMADGVERAGASGGPLLRHEMDRSSFVERALAPVLPKEAGFPFTVRLNAEALAADGGAGAAAVCGGAVAMADAGVPLKSLVAAVGVGMLSEGGGWSGEAATAADAAAAAAAPLGRYELVLDPCGLEISLGDMELRVAGTAEGITACQLDVQAPGGVPLEVVEEAMQRARVGRLRALKAMEAALPGPQQRRADHAPVFGSLRIPQSSVGSVIGREGAGLRAIEESSGAKVHVGDGGVLTLFAPSAAAFASARGAVRAAAGDTLTRGRLYRATVQTVKDFGAWVAVPGCDARVMLHVSEVAPERIRSVEDVLSPGDEIDVVFLGRDNRGTLRVSRKAALAMQQAQQAEAVGVEGGKAPPTAP